MQFEPIAILASLVKREVRFVLIGGVAGRIWGSPTTTNDIDICYDREQVNLDHLAGALVEIGARLRGVDDPVPFILDAETLARGQNFTFMTDLGPLDVLGMPAGIGGYAELAANAVAFDLGDDVQILVCALDDLIRMKEAAGRPKDRIELEVLAALREERGTGRG
jgi:hypothetical protein